MPRLPQPGSDDGVWGILLNEYLQVGHNEDGTHKTLPVEQGGTGATDAATARQNLGAAAADDLTATSIAFESTDDISATNVQDAIEEVAGIATHSTPLMSIVQHGDDAAVIRPAGVAAVYWVGSVEPENGVSPDLWCNTTNNTLNIME